MVNLNDLLGHFFYGDICSGYTVIEKMRQPKSRLHSSRKHKVYIIALSKITNPKQHPRIAKYCLVNHPRPCRKLWQHVWLWKNAPNPSGLWLLENNGLQSCLIGVAETLGVCFDCLAAWTKPLNFRCGFVFVWCVWAIDAIATRRS